MTETKKIATEDVVLYADCQHREQISQEAVKTYAEVYGEYGMDGLPPIRVFVVGEEHVCIDGFHRAAAAQQAGLSFVRVRVVGKGDLAQAAWEALKSNHVHGVRRTPEDKRKAVWQALENPIGQEQSSRVIAKQCGVSHPLVSQLRKQWEGEQGVEPPETRTGADGKSRSTTGNVSSSGGGGDENKAPSSGAAENEEKGGAEDPLGQAAASDPQGTGDGEAEPPPPSGGADDRPEWLPDRRDFEDAASLLKSASRKLANRENASGEEGQVAATIRREAKQLATKAAAMVPVVCPRCDGKGCRPCSKAGWLRWGAAQQLETSGRKRRGAA